MDVNFNATTCMSRNTKKRALSQHIMNVLDVNKPNQLPTDSGLTARSFYRAAYVPDRDIADGSKNVEIPGLKTKLYPFQRQTVQWLLMRERAKYDNTKLNGCRQMAAYSQSSSALPFSFISLKDINGRAYYASSLYHVVTRDIAPFQEQEASLRGGILAEEMGLGKTVEMISLILTHKRDHRSFTAINAHTDGVARPAGTTLIVTPETLLNQWLAEFKKLAPSLLVITYPGIKHWANDEKWNSGHQEGSLTHRIISTLAECDAVITTYNVLQTELHYAMTPPQRSMRHERQFERHTSPLVQIDWWRICLDEAQQVDSGLSDAAKTAQLIPRVNAWAVTGTPVKDNPNDLWGLLLFLRCEPFASYQIAWRALLTTHQTLFRRLFNKIAIRHSKQAVRNELKLPCQKRYVVTMPFTAIEEHNYQTQFKTLLAEVGLSIQGTPLHDKWDPSDPRVVPGMKRALAKLRQTLLHPELGSVPAMEVVYRTLTEHLEAMIAHSVTCIKTHQRAYLVVKLRRGQLLDGTLRVKEAINIWAEVVEELEPSVVEARDELRRALEERDELRNALEERAESINPSSDEATPIMEIPETVKVGDCRRQLRSILDLKHRAAFFIANAYFQIKSNLRLTKPDSDEYKRLEQREVESYAEAKDLRREILQEPRFKFAKLIKKLKERAIDQSLVEIPEVVAPDSLWTIAGKDIALDLEMLYTFLNRQADLTKEWREHIIRLLSKPLVDTEEGEDVTGKEYENSTEVQDHLVVYTTVLKTIISDRQEALSGLVNERIRQEICAAERVARVGDGHAPWKLLQLIAVRTKLSLSRVPGSKSLRGFVAALREHSTKLRHGAAAGNFRCRADLQVVITHTTTVQDVLTKQGKVVANLEREYDFLTSIMNARIEFYRQLQTVSDSVAPLGPEMAANIDDAWANCLAQETTIQKQITFWISTRRHRIHMKEQGSNSNDPCSICQDRFVLGAITTCGHTFCKECIVQWLNYKQRCPLCKEHQTIDKLSDFNRHPEIKPRVVSHRNSRSRKSKGGSGVYSEIPEEIMHAFQKVELDGPSYSTKVDTLIKHLLWLREVDPGAKSIIFTQFRGFLLFLGQALERHRIGYASFNQGGNRARGVQSFKDDPSIECLLMDAKAHSSGLNLVNASHVFVCEPLLNTALELQAIARVDRIGQDHETTVWLYVIEGTLEENIHTLSESRRLAHIIEKDGGKGKSTELKEEVVEAANSLELEGATTKKMMDSDEDGEVIDKGDLWECLFGPETPVEE
ncbi:SNF2 family N-terminal domain-containing protein [Nemania sp. FL0916]|nr:SNF2 family N-terminal domain-containing protein [Nemania sp. FL0916]